MSDPFDYRRYERNVLIPAIGEAGQRALLSARVLVVGLGGLGSPAALYLAAAGVGTLGLMDSDAVELSNLQRQILHTTDRIGTSKAESAAATLRALNPGLHLKLYEERLDASNARDIVAGFDAVVEACDNFEAKFLINDTCLALKRPFATAGILALSGQAQFVVPGQTACLRCLVPEIPQAVPTTAELGVLGAVPGILGALEAFEVIRYCAGIWAPEVDCRGRLHSVDGEAMRLKTLMVRPRPTCRCGTAATD